MYKNTVRTWMTPSPVTIGTEDSVWEAYKKMRHYRIRRLPVMDDGKLAGIITMNDVRSLAPLGSLPVLEQSDLAAYTKIERVMMSDPLTIGPDENIGEAARQMLKHKIGGLPVLENRALVGIISEADLFRSMIAENWQPQIVTPPSSGGEEVLWLRRGESIVIRPIRPDDAPRLQTAFAQMSPDTIYDRFMGCKKELPDPEARFLSSLDYDSQMALVATKIEARGEEIIIGVAHYYVLDDDQRCAEFAVAIADTFQCQGLGTHLMMRLMEYAQVHGIRTLLGFVRRENYRLLRFVQRSGLPVERKLRDGIWEIGVRVEGIDFSKPEKFSSHHMDKHHEGQRS